MREVQLNVFTPNCLEQWTFLFLKPLFHILSLPFTALEKSEKKRRYIEKLISERSAVPSPFRDEPRTGTRILVTPRA